MNIVQQSRLKRATEQKVHSTEEKEYDAMREYYLESVYWFHKGITFVYINFKKNMGTNK